MTGDFHMKWFSCFLDIIKMINFDSQINKKIFREPSIHPTVSSFNLIFMPTSRLTCEGRKKNGSISRQIFSLSVEEFGASLKRYKSFHLSVHSFSLDFISILWWCAEGWYKHRRGWKRDKKIVFGHCLIALNEESSSSS